MKAWPPPLNWASQAPGMALTSASALEAGITMSSVPDRLGEIAGEQQGKQSTSLLVWCARRVGQLRSDRGRGELSVGSSWVAGEQDELINQGRVIQGEDLGDESAQRPSQDAYALELERLDHSPGVVGELGDIEGCSVIR